MSEQAAGMLAELKLYSHKGQPHRGAAIAAMLLEGGNVEDITRKLRVTRTYVYSIRKQLMASGQLAGKNIG